MALSSRYLQRVLGQSIDEIRAARLRQISREPAHRSGFVGRRLYDKLVDEV